MSSKRDTQLREAEVQARCKPSPKENYIRKVETLLCENEHLVEGCDSRSNPLVRMQR